MHNDIILNTYKLCASNALSNAQKIVFKIYSKCVTSAYKYNPKYLVKMLVRCDTGKFATFKPWNLVSWFYKL